MAFAFYAKLAGKALTTESMITALESGKEFRDIFGGPSVHFSPTNHLGVNTALVAKIQNGRWITQATGQSYK